MPPSSVGNAGKGGSSSTIASGQMGLRHTSPHTPHTCQHGSDRLDMVAPMELTARSTQKIKTRFQKVKKFHFKTSKLSIPIMKYFA